MKRFLGRIIVAGVVVAGVAGCSAPKNYKQSSQQVSGQVLTPHSGASAQGIDRPVLSKTAEQRVAELTTKEAFAQAVVDLEDGMATKEAAFGQMTTLAECAGYFKASARAFGRAKKHASTRTIMLKLSAQYSVTSLVFGAKYSPTAKSLVNKLVDEATLRNTARFKRAATARQEIKIQGEVCQGKAVLVGIVTRAVLKAKMK